MNPQTGDSESHENHKNRVDMARPLKQVRVGAGKFWSVSLAAYARLAIAWNQDFQKHCHTGNLASR